MWTMWEPVSSDHEGVCQSTVLLLLRFWKWGTTLNPEPSCCEASVLTQTSTHIDAWRKTCSCGYLRSLFHVVSQPPKWDVLMYPSIYSLLLIQFRVVGGLKPIPAAMGEETYYWYYSVINLRKHAYACVPLRDHKNNQIHLNSFNRV